MAANRAVEFWLVYSPSRFSYMGWTPTRFFTGLQPCRRRQEFDSPEAAAQLAAEIPDAKVMHIVRQPVELPVENSADYW